MKYKDITESPFHITVSKKCFKKDSNLVTDFTHKNG